jgi:hypothetical protein
MGLACGIRDTNLSKDERRLFSTLGRVALMHLEERASKPTDPAIPDLFTIQTFELNDVEQFQASPTTSVAGRRHRSNI